MKKKSEITEEKFETSAFYGTKILNNENNISGSIKIDTIGTVEGNYQIMLCEKNSIKLD